LNIAFMRHIHFTTARCGLSVTNSKIYKNQHSVSGIRHYTGISAPEY